MNIKRLQGTMTELLQFILLLLIMNKYVLSIESKQEQIASMHKRVLRCKLGHW